jgi:hypothetical protein
MAAALVLGAPAKAPAAEDAEPSRQLPPAVQEAAKKEPQGWTRLSKVHDIWVDTKRKAVIADSEVCLREGQLEMFACPKQTKEHESIVAVNCVPEQAHAALLAIGAKPGKPVSFDPEYRAATGQVIDVYVLWTDAAGKQHTARAQDWIKHTKTGKPMEFEWVFAGSGFWTDEQTGKKHYQANAGDFICVSNFPTATLDLPVESTQANAGLLFEAFTEKIPPRGTKVRLVLVPRVKKEGDGEKPASR